MSTNSHFSQVQVACVSIMQVITSPRPTFVVLSMLFAIDGCCHMLCAVFMCLAPASCYSIAVEYAAK